MMTPETINLPNSLIDTISTWIYTDYYHLKSFYKNHFVDHSHEDQFPAMISL